MRNLILIIFGLIFLISEANGQIFTHKFHGYLEDDPVIFTLTFNRNNGKIFGYYLKAKDGIKRQIVGEFHKPPKVKPIVHPTPKYSGPIQTNNSNLFSLFEINPKTKVKKKRVSFNYGEQMSSVWTRGNNSDFIDINLFREYESKLETYQITEKQLIENEQKYEIAMFYPILSGENRNGINGLNQLIEQKIQTTINQFKQAAMKYKIILPVKIQRI
ncbi:MAG: hypothetical protein AAB336_01345, partial [Acidobacteriota bacterium]